MSKVLMLGNSDIVIYNFRLELVERLLSDGHNVIISAPYGERINTLVSMGCEYHDIKISRHGTNPIQDIKLINDYRKLIREVKPDIVFSYTIKPNIYGGMACKKYNVPYVVNITGLGTAVENNGVIQKITLMLYRFAFSKVRTVYFQNEENMEFFAKHKLALGKYVLLPGSGVNLIRFPYIQYPKDNIVRFAFVSRIMKEKGIDQFLDAAEYIKHKYTNTEFHVCGFCEAEYNGKLSEFNDNGIVIYHGMVNNVSEFMADMSCIVHPSYYPEGMSNVLLEACATGRPIITTDRSGCREVIEDGVNGYMISQKNSNALIEAIEKFLVLTVEEREQMGCAGRLKVEREFDRQIIVEKYIEEIESI